SPSGITRTPLFDSARAGAGPARPRRTATTTAVTLRNMRDPLPVREYRDGRRTRHDVISIDHRRSRAVDQAPPAATVAGPWDERPGGDLAAVDTGAGVCDPAGARTWL